MRLLGRFMLPGAIDLASLGLGLDRRVLTFTIAVGMLTATLAGIAPALREGGVDAASLLRGPRRGRSGSARWMFVPAQLALCSCLLVGMSLFARSLQAALDTNLGFDPTTLLAITVDPGLNGHDRVATRSYYRDVMAAIREIPGVETVAIASHVPLAHLLRMPFSAAGSRTGVGPTSGRFGLVNVTPGYFGAMGTPIIRGRSLSETDMQLEAQRATSAVQPGAVVNTAAADRLWPGEDPIGREISLFGSLKYTVVGVVETTKYMSVRDRSEPVVFTPLTQDRNVSVLVRSANPSAALALVREAMQRVDPAMPLRDARVVASQLDRVLMPQRFGATLLGMLVAIAVAVAAIGVYSTASYLVSQRTSEFGIRIALGARSHHVVGAALGRLAFGALAGIAIGLGVAAISTPLIAPFLYAVTPRDTLSFLLASAALVAVAIVAGFGPARRVTRVNPVQAIRSD
jgi:predicted permease